MSHQIMLMSHQIPDLFVSPTFAASHISFCFSTFSLLHQIFHHQFLLLLHQFLHISPVYFSFTKFSCFQLRKQMRHPNFFHDSPNFRCSFLNAVGHLFASCSFYSLPTDRILTCHILCICLSILYVQRKFKSCFEKFCEALPRARPVHRLETGFPLGKEIQKLAPPAKTGRRSVGPPPTWMRGSPPIGFSGISIQPCGNFLQ